MVLISAAVQRKAPAVSPSTLPIRILRTLFPQARIAPSWRAAMPLGIFLFLYGSLIIAAEARGWLRFTWPPAFWLMLTAPWVWWLQMSGASGLRGARAQVALQSRFWLVGLFVVLLAEPRAARQSDAISLVYALDVSDSIGPQASDRSLHWIAETAGRKPDDVLAILAAAEAPAA